MGCRERFTESVFIVSSLIEIGILILCAVFFFILSVASQTIDSAFLCLIIGLIWLCPACIGIFSIPIRECALIGALLVGVCLKTIFFLFCIGFVAFASNSTLDINYRKLSRNFSRFGIINVDTDDYRDHLPSVVYPLGAIICIIGIVSFFLIRLRLLSAAKKPKNVVEKNASPEENERDDWEDIAGASAPPPPMNPSSQPAVAPYAIGPSAQSVVVPSYAFQTVAPYPHYMSPAPYPNSLDPSHQTWAIQAQQNSVFPPVH